jgi:hypothetical protein
MTKIYGRCPRCKSRIKINDAERLDGRKITCRGCRYRILIRAPKTTSARNQSNDLVITEFFDDDEEGDIETIPLHEPDDDAGSALDEDEPAAAIDSDSELPAYQPMLYRRAAKKKERVSRDDDDSAATFVEAAEGGTGARGEKQNRLVFILGGVGGLLLVGLVVAGIVLLRSSGLGKSSKYEAPQKYVRFAPKEFQLSATVPQDWTQTYAGGQSGIPISARFSSGSISIDVRESIGGGALGQAAIAMQGAAPGVPKEAPVIGIHEYHRARFQEDYTNYNEEFGRPIKTRGYGEGRISDFTASEGLFGFQIKGCRATVMNPIHQFTVTCKCPPGQFKDVRPVFEKIINSLSTGGD